MDTITVYSSYKLTSTELNSVSKIALKQFGVEGKLNNVVDKSVIAGVKIIANGRELDLTTSGSIKRLGIALT